MSISDQPPDIERSRTRSRRVEEIFVAVLDMRLEERAEFLDRACAGDEELRRAVEGLLAMEGTQTLDPLPPGELAVGWGVADFHSSLKGLSLAPGRRIGRYALLRSLGQGGMGTVFLAHDTRLHRRVAIKFLHAETEQLTKRFLAEARVTARCKHENIVVIHDVDEIEGRPFMVLEHLEGEPLRHRLAGMIGNSDTASATPSARRREAGAAAPAMPVAEVLELVIPVVRALVCAHAQGIVHRDLKPENVFLCRNGTVKVLDFGIAKALIDPYRLDGTTADVAVHAATLVMEEPVMTAQGARLGTLPYMSPEQWAAGEIDERTDIWAVGIMLYEMLAGRHPLAPLSYGRLEGLVPDLDAAMPAIGDTVTGLGALAALVDHCLRKRSAERMASAQELLVALVAVHRQHAEGRPQRASAPLPGGEEPSVHLAAYAAWVRQKYEYLPMRGLGGLRLDLRLEEVHVPLELLPRERGRIEMGSHDDAPAALDSTTWTVRLEEAFDRAGPDRHLFVRGDPGTGKTTALTKMLWSVLDDAAEHGFDGRALGLPADTVPVFLPLCSLAGPALGRDFDAVLDDSLVELTRSPRRNGTTEPAPGPSAVPPGFGHWLWQRGHVLLLLDGLDEIADPKARAKVCRYIENVLDQAGPERVRAVVSSRFAGIQEEDEITLDHRRFLHLDVRHLDDEQMADLVNRWFTAAGAALDRMRGTGAVAQEAQYRLEADTVIHLLRSDAYASRHLKELVSTPLFLTLLCIVVFQGGQIPERRAEFFRECLRVLLMPWARRDGEQRLSLDESLDLLQHIAWHMHREERRDDLGEAELRRLLERPLRAVERHRERKLNVSSVIDWFRRTTGVLTEYGTMPAEYGFLHLSLQEYLAARYAATYPAEGIEMLATQFGSSWWREVTLLFVALPEYRHFGALMQQVITRGKLLSEREHVYQCLLEAHARDLKPFLALIADRSAPIAQRIEALRLVRDQDDDELIALASEIALEPLPEEAEEGSAYAETELRLLGEQVEAHASPRGDANPREDAADGVLVICAPADEARARALERSIRSWGWHAEVATSLRIEDEPWRRARAFVVLVGPEGKGPWQQTESRRCLVEMMRRELSMVSALNRGTDASVLPAFLQTHPQESLGENVQKSRLRAVLAVSLDVMIPDLATRGEPELPEEHVGQSFVEARTGIRFLWVPGGRFWMGSGPEGAFEDEKPRHLVEVSGYWLAETPVTNRQYEMFLRAAREVEEPRFWRDRKYNQPEQPVVGVSWLEAREFCRWLSEISEQRIELPTEAQWEFAARGEEGRTYPWGEEKPDRMRAHYRKRWDDAPMPVGRLLSGRGPFGHLDLAGNVLEWCRDAWDVAAYKKRGALSVDPEGPYVQDDAGVARVCRGGAFDVERRSLRSARRSRYRAHGRDLVLGFRVAALPTSR